jgi:two-component system NtrC family sensor kinase
MAERAAEADREQLEKSIAQLDRHVLESMCMRNLLANPEERVFFKDLDSRFVLVSAGFLLDQAPGCSLAEVTGKTDFDLFREEHAKAAFDDEQRIIRTGDRVVAKVERETFYDRPDAWVSTTKLPLRDEHGSIVGTFGISRDVTAQVLAEQALMESEERFRGAFERAPVGICWLDPAGVVVEVNPALTEITGRTAQQLVGTKAAAFWHPDDAVGTAADLGRLLRGDLDRYIRERRFVRADGSIRNVNVAVSVVRAPDGEGSPMAIATVEDVTERRQLADDLRQAQQMEALGQLAGGIAHEINTPIQFISDNLSFLSDILGPVLKAVGGSLNAAARLRAGEDPGDVAALLEQIAQDADLDFVAAEAPTALSQSQEGLERVATIVRAMKAFGRPDPSEPEPTDINRLVADAITVAGNEIKYVADVTADLGARQTVMCFPGAISQVVLNLLVNAAHAVGESQARTGERGHIGVKTWAEAYRVVIAVSDTGPGIPADVLPRIFQPYFTTKPFGQGTGQGLAMAWATVVNRHGSQIDVSTSEAGTTFTLSLPLAAHTGETPCAA